MYYHFIQLVLMHLEQHFSSSKSFIHSYELVSDESEHIVELLSERQNFTLRVDSGISRSMVNAGDQEYLDVDTPLFLGGVPPDVGRHAHAHWHLRNSTSFRGKLQYLLCW